MAIYVFYRGKILSILFTKSVSNYVNNLLITVIMSSTDLGREIVQYQADLQYHSDTDLLTREILETGIVVFNRRL